MEAALGEACTGDAEGGIPIGAALVDGQGQLVATGRNRRVQDRAVVMHAEINCLFNAGKDVENFRGIPSTQHCEGPPPGVHPASPGSVVQGHRQVAPRTPLLFPKGKVEARNPRHHSRQEAGDPDSRKGRAFEFALSYFKHPERPALPTPGGTEDIHHVRKCSNWRKAVHKKPGALVGAPPRPQASSRGTTKGGP